MAFVLDASVAGCWFFEDERTIQAEALLDRLRSETAHVPALWGYEVRNLLLVAERKGRIPASSADLDLDDLQQLNIEMDPRPLSADLLRLARVHRLTAYDAAYLELAQRLRADLATLDRKLAAAAQAEGVGLVRL